ncbi:MAG: hypothetical protein QNK24_14390 [Desulfuromusa sp.]|nr:hypothetical protein [Desulfuromusa sp.]
MKTHKLLVLMIFSFLLLSTSAAAISLDGSGPLLCSINDVIECSPDRECISGSASSVDLPNFFKVDVSNAVLSVPQGEEDARTSTIKSVAHLDGKLILQGVEQGVAGEDDAVGWTLSIDEEDGRMIFSSSREKAGFIIFGACTALK